MSNSTTYRSLRGDAEYDKMYSQLEKIIDKLDVSHTVQLIAAICIENEKIEEGELADRWRRDGKTLLAISRSLHEHW